MAATPSLPKPVNACFHVNSDGQISSLAADGCLGIAGFHRGSVIFTKRRPKPARLTALQQLIEMSDDDIRKLAYTGADAVDNGHNRNHADAALRALGLIK